MSVCLWFPLEGQQVWRCMCRFLRQWFSTFLSAAVSAFSSGQGLLLWGRRGSRAHRPPGRVSPSGSSWTPTAIEGPTARQHPHQRWSLSPQKGGLQNSFRWGHFMSFPLFASPAGPSFHLPRSARGTDSPTFCRLRRRFRLTPTGPGVGGRFPDGAEGQQASDGPQTHGSLQPQGKARGSKIGERSGWGARPCPCAWGRAQKREAAQHGAQRPPNCPTILTWASEGAERSTDFPPLSGKSFTQIQSLEQEGLCRPKSTWAEKQTQSPNWMWGLRKALSQRLPLVWARGSWSHPRCGYGRRGRSWGKTWNPGLVRSKALFLNLFPCGAGATWLSAGDKRVRLLPDLWPTSGPLLIMTQGPVAFPPRSAQSAEPDALRPVSLAPAGGVELNSFSFVLWLKWEVSLTCAGVRES